ncbi:MAG: hypothetical protein A2V81_03335 [Candidatus Abawacabacteria bacterium RBG_16_42_10]|uniref:Uncharacterized protein n=1 Tax=Candidatus Abawacabacteria bacterium RBG_16_42_10 TaxID=1817814 RepID=A0A1F4XJI8_9BACT|nr:MAG: hypothetical protein A2V81_03335 [Candidatus Abawacabacteria bacterium RBG_16_42_10]
MSLVSSIPPAEHPHYFGEREQKYVHLFETGIAQGAVTASDYTRRMIKYLQLGMPLDDAKKLTEERTPLVKLGLGFLMNTPGGDAE